MYETIYVEKNKTSRFGVHFYKDSSDWKIFLDICGVDEKKIAIICSNNIQNDTWKALMDGMPSDDVYKILKEEGKSIIIVTHDIAEAISICNRVVVLSKRPCSVKKIFDIEFDSKSIPTENRKEIKFSSYYDQIWREIDYEL